MLGCASWDIRTNCILISQVTATWPSDLGTCSALNCRRISTPRTRLWISPISGVAGTYRFLPACGIIYTFQWEVATEQLGKLTATCSLRCCWADCGMVLAGLLFSGVGTTVFF